MSNIIKSLTIASVLAVSSIAAQAQAGAYVGGEFVSTSVDTLSTKSGFGVYGGYDFNNMFAAEVGLRNHGSYSTYGGGSINLNTASISGLVGFNVNDAFKLYGRVGYNNISLSADRVSVEVDSGLMYGIGARFAISPNLGLRGEYRRIASDADTVSVGLEYKF